jgi:hypothetical protein
VKYYLMVWARWLPKGHSEGEKSALSRARDALLEAVFLAPS